MEAQLAQRVGTSFAFLLHAGALAGLQRHYADRDGAQWASKDAPLGAFVYSSYTEADYQTIWDEYLYISKDNWWVGMDFGKLNCSNADPRRADVGASLQQAWAQQARFSCSSWDCACLQGSLSGMRHAFHPRARSPCWRQAC
jgi:hypothetical protein